MPTKRPAEDQYDARAPKSVRVDQHPGDFSRPVKEKLLKSQRTGQACDRCKVRKIRCDGAPGGCSPCRQNNTECKTTDRITGRATSRGYTEAIESENKHLKHVVEELQQQLRDNGIEAKHIVIQDYMQAEAPQSESDWQQLNTPEAALWQAGQALRDGLNDDSQSGNLPAMRDGIVGQNYLGVSSSNSYLTQIRGTSLSIFGMEINLREFIPESDDETSPMSYRNFLEYARVKTADAVQPVLPSYQEAEQYATWYFRSLNPFIPVLHKPDFFQLLYRWHHESEFQPSAAESVMVHMVFSSLKFQYASRNGDTALLEDSHKHYRYALTFFHQLCAVPTLQELQALSMICIHLRYFPKPGAAWLVNNHVLSLAIETGLHRSAKAWVQTAPKRDKHEIEMRKRVFWSLMCLQVGLSGKMGRPMPLHLEEMDVELPEPMPDNLPAEVGIPSGRKCSFKLFIECVKVVMIWTEMYGTIYAIRQNPGSYESTVRRLEKELQNIENSTPLEMREDQQNVDEDRIFAHFVRSLQLETRILLHHPSLCRTTNESFIASNLDQCLEAESQMQHSVSQLQKYRCLDTTLVSVTGYLAAVLTTLFIWNERRDSMTSDQLAKLRERLEGWLEVLGDCGAFFGTGHKLQDAVRTIIDTSISGIGAHLATKTAPASPRAETSTEVDQQYQDSNGQEPKQNFEPSFNNTSNDATNGTSDSYIAQDSTVPSNQASYSASSHFAYPEPSNFTNTAQTAFDNTPYGSAPGIQQSDADFAARVARAAASAAAAASASASASQSQPQPQVTAQQQEQANDPAFMYQSANNGAGVYHAVNGPHGGPAAWRQFAEGMMVGFEPQEYATALMALGGGRAETGGLSSSPQNGTQQMSVPHIPSIPVGTPSGDAGQNQTPLGLIEGQQTWPHLTYHIG